MTESTRIYLVKLPHYVMNTNFDFVFFLRGFGLLGVKKTQWHLQCHTLLPEGSLVWVNAFSGFSYWVDLAQ